MTWGAVAAAGASLVVGYMGNKSADKQADKGFGLQQQELDMQREGLDFSKQQYADWKERYDPIYDDMMSEIDSGITPDYNAIAGDINQSFDSAQGMERREMQRYGIKPGDGAYGHGERDYAINRAAAHSGIRNKARQDSAGIKFQRLSGIHNTLQGVGTSAATGVRTSYNNVGNSMGNMAQSRFTQSANTRNQAGRDAAGVGAMIGGIDWGGAWSQAKGWFGGNQGGTGATVAGSGGQTPQQFYSSDILLKKDIVLAGRLGDINIYSWTWNELAEAMGITDDTVGVIAQEHINSGFVRRGDNGYLEVDLCGLLKSRSIH